MMESLSYVCHLVIALSGIVAAQAPSAEEVLRRIQSVKDSRENASIEVTWEEFKEGKPDGWEEQTFHWDKLGRRRVVYQWGLYDAKANRVTAPKQAETSDTLFDGEVVVYQSHYPDRDRVGNPLKGSDQKPGYRTAIIADGKADLRRGVESHRNPLEYGRDTVISNVQYAMSQRLPVKVEVAEPGRKVYRLEYSEPADSGVSYRRSEITIDEERGWLVTKVRSFGEKGNLVRSMDFEYAKLDKGTWVPMRASHKHWGQRPADSTPLWEWRFAAKVFRVNDPDFDQSVFDVALEPDTAVTDTRFQVSYRIGIEKATSADLARLAEEARTEKQESESPPPPRRHLWVIMAANVVVLIAVWLLVAASNRRRAKRPV